MKIPRKVKTNLDGNEYCDSLKKKGYRLLGSGAFARVYGKKGSREVIKVGQIDYRDAYLDFLRKIDRSNPHFPKVKSIKTFKCKPCFGLHSNRIENYYVVKMERLIPFTGVKKQAVEKKLDKLGIISHNWCYDRLAPLGEDLDFTPKTKHMRKVKQILKELYRKHNEDMHDGNVMWRKKGRGHQLVITDPVA